MISPRAIAAAVVVAGIGGWFLTHGGPPGTSGSPAPVQSSPTASMSTPSARTPGPSPSAFVVTPLPVSTPLDLGAAKSDATAFTTTFAAYIYGKSSVSKVTNVTDDVRPALPGTLSYFSADERTRAYSILDVTVTPSAAGIGVVAVISESGASYHLNYSMASVNGSWKVDKVPTFGS